jgi:excisionase family DNA binding protein
MEERHVPLSTVAGRLGVSERTVRRWIKAGKLKATRPGRDYRIPESALRELVEEGKVSPKAPASPSQRSLFNGGEEERHAAISSQFGSWRGIHEESVARWSRAIERGFSSADAAAAFCAEVIAEGAVGQTIIKRYLIPQTEVLLPEDEAARERQELLETHTHLEEAMHAVVGVVEGMVDSENDADAASKAIGRYLDQAVSRGIAETREERHDRPDLELWLRRERRRRQQARAQTGAQSEDGKRERPTA